MKASPPTVAALLPTSACIPPQRFRACLLRDDALKNKEKPKRVKNEKATRVNEGTKRFKLGIVFKRQPSKKWAP
jgi:hypothetical protein